MCLLINENPGSVELSFHKWVGLKMKKQSAWGSCPLLHDAI